MNRNTFFYRHDGVMPSSYHQCGHLNLLQPVFHVKERCFFER
jgi:hypothetical protein